MAELSIHPLSFLSSEIEARKRPDSRILPEELSGVRVNLSSHPATSPEPMDRKRPAEQNRSGPRQLAPDGLPAHLVSMLALARPKTSKDLRVATLFPTDSDAARILGPEFMALVIPRGQAPCLRHHIFATCHTPGCQYSHQLRSRPSLALIEGMASRIQARLHEIIQQFPKAEGESARQTTPCP
jgi:hypothetical protein